MSLPPAPVVRFHLSLNVSDLGRSVAFYRTLFDREPAKVRPDYAKFEPDDPPLVLSLEPGGRPGPGTLNHLGIRLPDAPALVAVQERLERAGVRTRWEEGVECCYAQQTKFWVTDPDGTLWEMYVLEADLDHRGGGPPAAVVPDGPVWEHRLGDPVPDRLAAADGSFAEARLEGSFNGLLPAADRARLLGEVRRALRSGGRVVVRALAGGREVTAPGLPGPAAVVEVVPAAAALVAAVEAAGFGRVKLTAGGGPPCFVVDGVGMRETYVEGWKA